MTDYPSLGNTTVTWWIGAHADVIGALTGQRQRRYQNTLQSPAEEVTG